MQPSMSSDSSRLIRLEDTAQLLWQKICSRLLHIQVPVLSQGCSPYTTQIRESQIRDWLLQDVVSSQ